MTNYICDKCKHYCMLIEHNSFCEDCLRDKCIYCTNEEEKKQCFEPGENDGGTDSSLYISVFWRILQKLRGGKTQEETAREIGIPLTTYQETESIHSEPNIETVRAVCKYYGITLTQLSEMMHDTENKLDWSERF